MRNPDEEKADSETPKIDPRSYAIQADLAGRLVNVNSKDWIILYKVPVEEPADPKLGYFIMVEKDATLPAPCYLMALPLL